MVSSRFRRFLRWALRPAFRFETRHADVGDPWKPVSNRFVNPQVFGPGSLRRFPWYFEGESAVEVGSIEELSRWLIECRYVSDDEMFDEADFWQHPCEFEALRKGDCEDHALWAWRKLIELGHPAEFFVGQWFRGGDEHRLHSWVVFEQDGQSFLLEPVAKAEIPMILPLSEVRTHYAPHFSVGLGFAMRSHAGYLLYFEDRKRRHR